VATVASRQRTRHLRFIGGTTQELTPVPETPEQKARRDIDAKLIAPSWLSQNRDDLDLTVDRSIAVKSGFGFANCAKDARHTR
jgi:hypothetical protein